MKTNLNSSQEVRYIAPEAEVMSLESVSMIDASGTFNTDPWANGNNDWCN